MKREIKFRAWNKDNNNPMFDPLDQGVLFQTTICVPSIEVMQFTGLQDKNGNGICIYEGDIVSLYGIIIGNKHENEQLLKDKTNLLIDGFGTKTWRVTEKEAVVRGCYYSE